MQASRYLSLILAMASLSGQGATLVESGTATFHVGAMSCVSCEKAIRASLGKMKSVEVVLASAEAKRVRLRFDQDKISLQEILATLRGKEGKYESRLALRFSNPKISNALAEKSQVTLAKVPGLRAASLPDAAGVILITFRSQPPTFLPSILKAAAAVGAPLEDPATKSSLP